MNFNKQRLGILIAAAVGMLGTFLPWANVLLLGSISGTSVGGWGWTTFGLFAVTAVMAFMGDRKEPLKGSMLLVGVLTSLAAAGVGVWKIVDLNSLISESDPYGLLTASIGVGLYVIVLAGIAVPVVAFLLKGGVVKLGSVAKPAQPATPQE